MLNQTVIDAMNEQIKNELYSAYLYLAMSAYAESVNLPGTAHWLREQAEEEQDHAMKFYHFIVDRGGRVVFKAIEQPPVEFEGLRDIFEKTLAHEQKVTALIHDLYALAKRENDYPSEVFLQWFVKEQVEEEKHATEILEAIKLLGESKQGLAMLDRELGGRSGD